MELFIPILALLSTLHWQDREANTSWPELTASILKLQLRQSVLYEGRSESPAKRRWMFRLGWP